MPAVTGVNSLDFLKGALPRIQVGVWVTAGGATTLVDLGFLRDVAPSFSRDIKFIEADNSTYEIDGYTTKSTVGIKGTILESSLRHMAMSMGDLRSEVSVASGSASYPLDEPDTENKWQVVLTVTGQSMKPGHTEFPNDVYIKRVITLWRCVMMPKIDQAYKKGDEVVVPFEIRALKDTSVTASATVGQIGKIVDSTT